MTDLDRNISSARHRRLENCCCYVLVDGRDSTQSFDELVAALVAANVGAIQLREKTLSDRDLLSRARRLRLATERTETLFIMNDRADLAVLSAADGIHVGQDELEVADVRAIVGAEMLIGVSTHSVQQARQAEADRADYIGVGPTFPSRTKQFTEFTGLELLSSVAKEIQVPAFAIGGITLESLEDVIETGVRRVAVGAAITEDRDPAASARKFVDRLANA